MKLSVRDKENRKRITSVEIGTKTQCLLVENRIPEKDVLTFRYESLEFFVRAVEHLQEKLPFESKILDDCQILHPGKRNGTHALNSISRLALEIMKQLKTVLATVFGVLNRTTEIEICDMIRNE